MTFSGNSVSPAAAEALATEIGKQETLTSIDLGDIFTARMREEIPPAMAAFYAAIKDKNLESLIVEDNAFGPDGIKPFIDILVDCKESLKVFNCNNTGLSPEGGRIIANALLGYTVESYGDAGEALDTVLKASDSADGSPVPSNIETFIVGRSRLEDGGALALSKAFSTMKSLVKISIPQNGINREGMRAIATSLADNPLLEVLDVNDNNIGPEGAAVFAEILPQLKKLRVLDLGDTMLEGESISVIAEALKDHTTLEFVNFNYSEIDDDVAEEIADKIIKNNKNLKTLWLDGNELHTAGLKAIQDALIEIGQPVLPTLTQRTRHTSCFV
eukprot:TRINITY_DN2537_c0_g1_i2.p1 TRINITY_DN2537_c0_g1~~TRINITY_DN2537_c0_g1_i2.p1  ORF type:complete len:366 (-),score=83.71 TRINITY_DN2537_c0_g1_i2:82-1071(-)